MKRHVVLLVAIASVFVAACDRAPQPDSRLLSIWMHTLYGAVRVERVSPPVGSRFVAYGATALYSGLAVVDPTLKPLHGVLNEFPELPAPNPGQAYDGTLVAVAAERTVLDSLLREGLATTRASMNQLADSLEHAQATGGDTRERSQKLGREIGLRIVKWAHGDGFDSTRGRKYVAPVGAGLWINDSPGYTYSAQNISGASTAIDLTNPSNLLRPSNGSDRELILNRPKKMGSGTLPPVNMSGATEPYWGQLRPFVLKTWNECAAAEAPKFGMTADAQLYKEAREVYDIHEKLTPDQRTTALYWADNPGESGTPSGHWTSIASQLVSERNLSAADAARATTLTAVAVADAFIAVWGYKFKINLIRPRTYIRAVMDSTWEPLISTPPFPEYMSGHSAISASAAAALTALLGATPFSDSTSIAIGHDPRQFTSFRAAADEAGMSRIYGGIHFPSGNRVGGNVGRCVGNKVVERFGITPVAVDK